MSIYLNSGYLDIRKILNYGMPFNFVVGGRGTGKTYGALRTCIEDRRRIMFMRRTNEQLSLINQAAFSPLKPICEDLGLSYSLDKAAKNSRAMYIKKEDEEPFLLGYTCALSTISNMRGFSAEDAEILIYDEFIPEKHERPIKNEGMAFDNAYETINRNRELNGKAPLQVLALANANELGNPIFLSHGLVMTAEKLRQKRQSVFLDRERGVGLFILQDSPISGMKSETALYRFAAGSEYSGMALGNEFQEDRDNIKSCSLIEFRPVVTVGEITIYRHKSERRYYVSSHRSGSPVTFGCGDNDRERFARSYGWVWDEFMNGNLYFETYLCQILLEKYTS